MLLVCEPGIIVVPFLATGQPRCGVTVVCFLPEEGVTMPATPRQTVSAGEIHTPPRKP
ncbi:hypothetical protein LMG26411_05438 [Cupriavidus numazuensis]|uniref:Uncharacterized protein n=1 Tax=Cupriavidus numazuensis TaxID=221992 RepID=A0ABM8TPB2_9BURK|nr:hypothetical protein LMG26411_05438 [Cupriavidus numazuensis]